MKAASGSWTYFSELNTVEEYGFLEYQFCQLCTNVSIVELFYHIITNQRSIDNDQFWPGRSC